MELIDKYFPGLTELQRQQFAALYGLYADWNAKDRKSTRLNSSHSV